MVFFNCFTRGNPEGKWVCAHGVWVSQGVPSYPKPQNPCGQKIALPKDKEGCIALGGFWKKQGPEPFETCNVKAIDRGSICHDNSECQGMCQVNLTADELRRGMNGKPLPNKKYGQCSLYVVELGCYGVMKNGKTQVICVD